jgi:hypothetical protein
MRFLTTCPSLPMTELPESVVEAIAHALVRTAEQEDAKASSKNVDRL